MQEENKPESKSETGQVDLDEKMETYEFKTPDEKVNFVLLNVGDFDNAFIRQTEQSLLEMYGVLRKDLEGFNLWNEVYITLTDKRDNIYASPTTLKLGEQFQGTAIEMRLVFISLLHYDRYNKGTAFLNRGHQFYIENKFNQESQLKQTSAQALLVIIDKGLYIPLEELVDPFEYQKRFKEHEDIVTLQAFSFANYLIETYGLEKFA
jgi:hypothetical protein